MLKKGKEEKPKHFWNSRSLLSLIWFRNHTSQNGSESLSNSLNLPLYTKLSQSVSHTLRASAKEAEFYMKRHGKMKTASGSLAIGKKYPFRKYDYMY